MSKLATLTLVLLSSFSFASNDLEMQKLIPLETATSIVMNTTSICLASDHRVKRLTKNERERLSSALLFVFDGDTDTFNSEIYKGELKLINHSKKNDVTGQKAALSLFNFYCDPLFSISTGDLSLEKEIQTNLSKLLPN